MLALKVARRVVRPSSAVQRLAVSHTSKRTYTSTMHDNDAEVLEREKLRNLSGRQYGVSTPIEDAPGWNEDLATTSEADVKADRSKASLHDIQKKTVEYIRSRHQPDERMEHSEASYVRDEVTGPLGSARVGEFEGVVGDGDRGFEEIENDINSDSRTVNRHLVHEEMTEIRKEKPTESEEDVRADRGLA
ncbi:hypothetical protein F5I97DRAFT_1889101 [Phlebopus sp. FC_14]|nr:hypothetical protein F5I97DRAFT_1889101 [Phlebopus sp. FC_14]